MATRDLQPVTFSVLDSSCQRIERNLGTIDCAAPKFTDRTEDPVNAFNTLAVQGEASHDGVRHLHGADSRRIGDAGAAVNQHPVVVVVGAHLRLCQTYETGSTKFIEALPVEGVHPLAIGRVLFAGADEVYVPSGNKVPIQSTLVFIEGLCREFVFPRIGVRLARCR